jgi:hypothetical protein
MRLSAVLLVIVVVFTLAPTSAQIRPVVSIVGGDDAPVFKNQVERTLEQVLLEMNRLQSGTGNRESLRVLFSEDAFRIFEQYVLNNKATTARKNYSPQMIRRLGGVSYDVRSIAVRVDVGETQASDAQNLVFTFSRQGLITSVRAVIPNQDYESVISFGTSAQDSLTRGMILDFMERFRMAYNMKDLKFLEQVYSDDALIIVGTVLKTREGSDDFTRRSLLSPQKVKLLQVTKQQYLTGLKNQAFKTKSFLNVRFEEVRISSHARIPRLYGVSCWQEWNSATYKDRGYLFLMMDFRDSTEPTIHVRTWQPKSFDDGTYVGLYDFDVVE